MAQFRLIPHRLRWGASLLQIKSNKTGRKGKDILFILSILSKGFLLLRQQSQERLFLKDAHAQIPGLLEFRARRLAHHKVIRALGDGRAHLPSFPDDSFFGLRTLHGLKGSGDDKALALERGVTYRRKAMKMNPGFQQTPNMVLIGFIRKI